MVKNNKKPKINQKYKSIKLESDIHKKLRIYAAENDLWLGEAVATLLNKVSKQKK